MNTINWNEIKRINSPELGELLPLQVMVNGIPTFVLDKVGSSVPISDLHIRVQNKIRALVARARVGMPAPKKIYADEVNPVVPKAE